MAAPAVFDNPEKVAEELGAAMSHPAFQHILALLEGYEQRILLVGIDDPDQSKDFLRGAVHAARSMRASLLSAKQAFDAQADRAQAASDKTKRERVFLPPGGGPGGLS